VTGGKNRALLLQLIRYFFTGGFVTLVGQSIFSALVLLKFQPNLSYGVAWVLGLGLGYTLHSRFSFAGHGERGDLRRTGGRFVAVNLIGLALNQSWVALTIALHLSPLWANLPMVTLTPLLIFTLHRHWSFG
jgi:putative flippase GtrA